MLNNNKGYIFFIDWIIRNSINKRWGYIVKIVFFTDSYKPYLSGVVKSIDTFRTELARQGHEVYIFAPNYPSVEEQEGVYRFTSLPIPAQSDFRLAIPFSNKILADLRRLKPDIIHTHTPFLMGWLARFVANKLGIPLVFTYHTLYDEYAHYFPFVKKKAKGFITRYCFNFCQTCDLVISPSNFVERRLHSNGTTVPIWTIPTGINLQAYNKRQKADIREKYGLTNEDKILLFVGRLAQEKNILFLLKSFQIIAKSIAGLRLILVGNGPEKANLQKEAVSLGISNQVIFAGGQQPERVIDFYHNADLFVFPSVTETQGLVILEAMAGGLPVVAVNAAGSTSIVKDGLNGLLVEEDKFLFAQAVIELLGETETYEHLKKNVYKEVKKLSIEKMTVKLLDSYHRIIEINENKFTA